MGCQQLTYQKNNFLKVVHRKNGQVQKKNVLDYFSFGMPMPNRNVEGNYRYKYQGQEKDPETGMEAFELRLWDSRIGRWLTTDPAGEFFSPYLGMGNNPISRIDPDGGMTDDPPTESGNYNGQIHFDPDTGNSYSWDGSNWHSDMAGGYTLPTVVIGGASSGGGLSDLSVSAIGATTIGVSPLLTAYDSKISNILKNRNSFVTVYEPVQIDDILNFKQQDFDEYLKISQQQKNLRVIDTELRSSLKTLSKSVKGVGYGVGALGFLVSVDQYREGDISGEILALDGVMTVVSFAGPVGAGVSLFYFVIIRAEPNYFPGIRNGVNDVRGVRVDNTRVHMKIHKVHNIKVINE